MTENDPAVLFDGNFELLALIRGSEDDDACSTGAARQRDRDTKQRSFESVDTINLFLQMLLGERERDGRFSLKETQAFKQFLDGT